MNIETVVVGDLQTNCYIAYDPETKETVIIDPGAAHAAILKKIEEKKLKPLYILHTHGHPDHFGSTDEIKKATGARVMVHNDDAHILQSKILSLRGMFYNSTKVDRNLKEGDEIRFGKEKLKVIHTPGHSKGCICFYSEADSILFSGDTMFKSDVGRTDLPGGSEKELAISIKKLFNLPDSTRVLPGHGRETTIADEKETWRRWYGE